jgi:DnaJ-class molecular chaperone
MQRCTTCGGSGVVKGTTTIECAACDGTGQILSKPCSVCHGKKVQTIDTEVLCKQCNGKGYWSSREPRK